MSKTKLGLYLHIPYCERKCNYCDFYSGCDLTTRDDYVRALVGQMRAFRESAKDKEVDTVYLGGGTPTLLPPGVFQMIFDNLHRNFSMAKDAEISCECNPSSMTPEVLQAMKKCGINRLSVGVQSADDGELAKLGRLHCWEEAKKSLLLAKDAGFSNISVDLMYALPEQKAETFFASLEKVLEFSPQHISLYGLKVEEGTPFFAEKESLHLPDEDTETQMYFGAVKRLAQAGFLQYEISNFAQEGKACRHNLKYWNCDEYLGFGPAASSLYDGKRFTYARDTKNYISAFLHGDKLSFSEEREVDAETRLAEYVMLRFRLAEGVKFADFSHRFGSDFEERFGNRLCPYVAQGLVVKQPDGYRFTPHGFFLSNYVLSDILDFE